MKRACILLICIACLLPGCALGQADGATAPSAGDVAVQPQPANTTTASAVNEKKNEEILTEIELTDYFQGADGCAVIYDETHTEYWVYKPSSADIRSSPCSTFKVISTLIGLQAGVLDDETTLLSWNGTPYPVQDWNQDLTLRQAFHSSCIWYFREVIDRAGEEAVQQTLSELDYGNCDSSAWEGSDTNAGYAELNGFWLDSSLLISPREQVEVMRRLFSDSSVYAAYVPLLKDLMLVEDTGNGLRIYGKTGTSRQNAWFVGFAEKEDQIYPLCIRLDALENGIVSGQQAKEIAINVCKGCL